MRKIYDARCSAGHVTEVFGYSDETFRCGECNLEAKRIISPIRCQLEGVSGDFPDAAAKWARRHEKAARRGDNG